MRRTAAVACFVVSFLLILTWSAEGQTLIHTVAGGGPDGVPAISANLPAIVGVSRDSVGDLYIAAQRFQNRVFRVDVGGQLTLVAGDGLEGFRGNGGAARNSRLDVPYGAVADDSDNIYIADALNHRVRRVDALTGVITTFAGNGTRGFSGDGGLATNASLNYPYAVVLDHSGNVLIADSFNERIRRVDRATGIITTIAGSGGLGNCGDGGPAIQACFDTPVGLAVDSTDDLFIADMYNRRIRRVDATTGIITLVGGSGFPGDFCGDGGPAAAACLNMPTGVAVDDAGNLFIADRDNQRIRRVDASTGVITTVAGNGNRGFSGDGGAATAASLDTPYGVAVDGAGNFVFTDTGNGRLRRVDASTGIITTFAGNGTANYSGDGFDATSASLAPYAVAVDSIGNLFISDESDHRIRRVGGATGAITTVAGNGTAGFNGDGGLGTNAELNDPHGVAVDSAGNLFIADWLNFRIRRVDAVTGVIATVAGNGANGFSGDGGPATAAAIGTPEGVAVDGWGNLFIVYRDSSRLRRVDAVTGIITTFASVQYATGVAVDSTGNIYVAEYRNNRIRKVDGITGLVTTVAGNGTQGFSGDGGPATDASLYDPTGVAVDSDGNLFIADTDNTRVRRVDASTGIITTFAGNGIFDFAGDGGPPTAASFDRPYNVAVDLNGNVFVPDTYNYRVRKVGP